MLSIQDDMPSLRLGFALNMVSLKVVTKSNLHDVMEHGIFPNISPFLWFHKLQHPIVTISMKNGMLYLSLPSKIISWMCRSVFHSMPIFHQKFWLKVHENSRWVLSSMSSSLHKTQEVESKWNDFLVSSSHVFILSFSINQQKNLCLGRQQDFQIHLMGSAVSYCPIRKL